MSSESPGNIKIRLALLTIPNSNKNFQLHWHLYNKIREINAKVYKGKIEKKSFWSNKKFIQNIAITNIPASKPQYMFFKEGLLGKFALYSISK